MKLKVFKTEITRCILAERERCAAIAEKNGSIETATEIRAARPPAFRVVHPATIEAHPELLARQDLVVSGLTAKQVVSGQRMTHYDASRPQSAQKAG